MLLSILIGGRYVVLCVAIDIILYLCDAIIQQLRLVSVQPSTLILQKFKSRPSSQTPEPPTGKNEYVGHTAYFNKERVAIDPLI